MSTVRAIHDLGGLAATHELHARGFTRHHIAWAVAELRIIRVRQGWYCSPDLDEAQVQAARIGGALTCVSAARAIGLATVARGRVHVAVPDNAARLRRPNDKTQRLRTGEAIVHWREADPRYRLLVGVHTALRQMVYCQPIERTVAAADSALRQRFITRSEWHELTVDTPPRLRDSLRLVDAASDSIIESIFRFRMQMLGLTMASQVTIPGVGRVDFLIDERLVIELDGFEWHGDKARFEADRRRDARLSIRGFRVLRFSYDQIMNHWSEVKVAVCAAIARRDHH